MADGDDPAAAALEEELGEEQDISHAGVEVAGTAVVQTDAPGSLGHALVQPRCRPGEPAEGAPDEDHRPHLPVAEAAVADAGDHPRQGDDLEQRHVGGQHRLLHRQQLGEVDAHVATALAGRLGVTSHAGTVPLKRAVAAADAGSVSDLSRLLDDVYGGPGAPVDPTPPAPRAPLVGLPDWAMDSVLDEAVAGLVPEPVTAPVQAVGAVDAPAEHLERALGTSRRSAFSDVAAEPVPVAAAVEWCRADDDILPARRTKWSKRGRSSAAADDTAPAIERFAAVEDQAPARRGRLQRRKR